MRFPAHSSIRPRRRYRLPPEKLLYDALALGIYALAILDLGLPGLKGLDVLRRLRARKATMPVLILTALDTLEDRVSGFDLGADDYLAKPFACRGSKIACARCCPQY